MATALLIADNGIIDHHHCASYIHAIQQADWFRSAFEGHAGPVSVLGGRGLSRADALLRQIRIGTDNRHDAGGCELACLHELAHVVTPDHGPGRELREPRTGRESSKGHHHAWRVNFGLIVRQVLGRQAAVRLRHEFNQWGLTTHK